MVDKDEIERLWGEISRLNRGVDALERQLARLAPEDLAQIQVHLAVLENSLINLKNHIDSKHKDTESDIERLDKDKLHKSEARIPHLLIYGMVGSGLLALLYTFYERIGLNHP